MNKKEENSGKLSPEQIRKLLNKKAQYSVAYDLGQEDPTLIKEWIPIGSKWLDSIIVSGRSGGIPSGRMSELAGFEASGKSYLALQIVLNAQKMGYLVYYMDVERTIDRQFFERMGGNLSELIYLTPNNIEEALEIINTTIGIRNKNLYILDSLAMCPTANDDKRSFDATNSVAEKARIMAKGLPRLVNPLADTDSSFLILNQLRQRIAKNQFEQNDIRVNPYSAPGGNTLAFAYSLRIWLTSRKAKAAFVSDENNYRIGSEVKCTLKKSKFGTEGRVCTFKILWGGDKIAIQDEESWFEAIQSSERFKQSGAWNSITYLDGTEKKFQRKEWVDLLEKDSQFRSEVEQILEHELIYKFAHKEGKAGNYYSLQDDEDLEETSRLLLEEEEI